MKSVTIEGKYKSGLQILNTDVESAIQDFLILNLSEKISEFTSECEIFKYKYKMNFNAYEQYLNKKADEENFKEEEYYLSWKFAHDNLKILKNKLDEIK